MNRSILFSVERQLELMKDLTGIIIQQEIWSKLPVTIVEKRATMTLAGTAQSKSNPRRTLKPIYSIKKILGRIIIQQMKQEDKRL